MNIKNQKTLIVFASIIIGLTAAALFTLNLVVEKISKITPPPFAMDMPRKMPSAMGTDDAIKNGPAPHLPKELGAKGQDDAVPTRIKKPEAMPIPNDAMRRVRGGKDAPDIRRMPPPAYNGHNMGTNDSQKRPPSPPPAPPMQNAPGQPQNGRPADEQQRIMMEQEMERQRQMYYNAPPPDYYPPPADYYDPGYNGGDGYDYDYDNYYDQGYEGKKEQADPNRKTAAVHENAADHEEDGHELDLDAEDEYLHDLLEE